MDDVYRAKALRVYSTLRGDHLLVAHYIVRHLDDGLEDLGEFSELNEVEQAQQIRAFLEVAAERAKLAR